MKRCMISALSIVCAVAAFCSAVPMISAQSPNIPEFKKIQLNGLYDGHPYEYIGELQEVLTLDVDQNGVRETVAYYQGTGLCDPEYVTIDGFYDVYEPDCDTPVTCYAERHSLHSHATTQLMCDLRTGRIFIGWYEMVEDAVYCLYPTKERDYPNYRLDAANCENVVPLDSLRYSLGDADGDAELSISDANAILSAYAEAAAGLSSTFTQQQYTAADFDQDGSITVQDAASALMVYAEAASGMLDTVLLPKNATDKGYGIDTVASVLERVFYLDIDQDGRKETIGRYIPSNAPASGSCAVPYLFRIYDDGAYQMTTGFNTGAGMVQMNYLLLHDSNSDTDRLVCVTSRAAALYYYTSMAKVYPPSAETQTYVCYLSAEVDPSSYAHTETVELWGNPVSRQELLQFTDNFSVIAPFSQDNLDAVNFRQVFNEFDTYFHN